MPLLTPEQTQQAMLKSILDELRKGAVQKKHPFHNVVLSTISANNPASRWVVFRKLTAENHFLIFTDARSQKVEELKKNPHTTLLFYHQRQGVQVRVNGTATLHHQDDLTATYWPGVKGSPGAKSYQTVAAPGEATPSIASGNNTDPSLDDTYFMVIEVIPHHIEALQLGREGHIRVAFEKNEDQWKGSLLVP